MIGRTVSAAQIADTPLSSRRATQVAQLVPGTIGGNMGGLPTAAATFATGITSINGGRSEEFMTTVDGAPSIRVRANGGFTMGMQNADTVEEVQVLTTNYQAEHGRASAGLLRAGHQERHPAVPRQRVLDRPGRLAQRQHLDEQPGRHRRSRRSNFNQYRLHARRSHLHPRRIQHRPVQAVLLLGRGMGSHPLGGEPAGDRAVGRDAQRRLQRAAEPGEPYFRAVRLIRDPLTGLPCTAADQRGCFPGNIIPRDRISPNGLALLNSYPLPTPGFQQGTNNWIGTPATFDDTRKDSIKIDYVPASNHRIAVRHTWAPHVWNDPESATAFSSIWDYPGRTMAATYTGDAVVVTHQRVHVLVGLDRSRRGSSVSGTVTTVPAAPVWCRIRRARSIGLNYPFIFPGTKLDPDKLSNLAIQNFSTLTLNQYPGNWYDFVFLWSDSVTKITGNHTFKAGVSVERSGMKDQIQLSAASAPATTNQNGSFRFIDATRPDGTGLAISNALLGLFDDYTEFGNKPLTNFIGMGYDFYAQDSWKVDAPADAGARSALLAVAAVARREQRHRVVPVGVLRSRERGDDRSRERLRRARQRRSVQRHRPAWRQRHRGGAAAVPAARRPGPAVSRPAPGFAADPKDGLQPRLGMAYALSERRRPSAAASACS